jgi:N-acetylglucosaminyldiphosphoundecaprenol N-acetyl-beta-D-mannosaminyltransferase
VYHALVADRLRIGGKDFASMTDLGAQSIDLMPLHWRLVLGMRTDSTSYADAVTRVLTWASARESRYVCVANVHVTMESYDSAEFQKIVNGADLVTPDGMPLVWALRLFGLSEATQVRGPSLTVDMIKRAAAAGVPIGFYGGTPAVLELLIQACKRRFPELRMVYAHAPPFRQLTAEEDASIIREINASGAAILFVGLGCPKQERWMALHRGSVNAVMLGVGAAFDFLSGVKPEAPYWMQRAGLEWIFRLATEPRRLWWRYAYHNPRFVVLLARQYLKSMTA